jgi:hypothetical protein
MEMRGKSFAVVVVLTLIMLASILILFISIKTINARGKKN